MKILNTPTMQALLKRGLRMAKRKYIPGDGMMLPLFTEQKKNGWYYQIDLVHDTRWEPKPYVVVFAFKPPRVYWAKSADYHLSKAL
jgi:hypothetical protein